MRQLTIGEFTLEEKALNDALTRMGRTLNLLRVHFRDETVRIESLGRPAAEVMMRLRIGPDPWKPRGDNLWLTNERIRLAGWRVPFAWLLNMALGDYSPAIAPDQIDATLHRQAGIVAGAWRETIEAKVGRAAILSGKRMSPIDVRSQRWRPTAGWLEARVLCQPIRGDVPS